MHQAGVLAEDRQPGLPAGAGQDGTQLLPQAWDAVGFPLGPEGCKAPLSTQEASGCNPSAGCIPKIIFAQSRWRAIFTPHTEMSKSYIPAIVDVKKSLAQQPLNQPQGGRSCQRLCWGKSPAFPLGFPVCSNTAHAFRHSAPTFLALIHYKRAKCGLK